MNVFPMMKQRPGAEGLQSMTLQLYKLSKQNFM